MEVMDANACYALGSVNQGRESGSDQVGALAAA